MATLHHVFRRMDADAFESALGRWAQECLGDGEATIAIDGKVLRGIQGGELPGVRLVAAYAGESGLILGQKGGLRGECKESELGLAANLLAQLELQGKVVTWDALYAQRELGRGILEQGGDYFWALKNNQPGMREAVSLLFEQPPWGESFAGACQEAGAGTGGKSASVGFDSSERIPGLARSGAGLLRGTCQETQGQGDGGAGLRYHQPAAGAWGRSPVAFDMAGALGDRKPASLGAGRGVWRGPKKGSAPQLLAALRNLVTGMLRLSGVKNIAAAPRHYGWNPGRPCPSSASTLTIKRPCSEATSNCHSLRKLIRLLGAFSQGARVSK